MFGGLMAMAMLQAAVPAATPPTEKADIIVEGWRNHAKLETQVQTPTAVSGPRHRKTYEVAEQMARCAARSRLSSIKLLHEVIDGEFNSALQAFAQDRLKRTYITCGEGWATTGLTTPDGPPMSMSIGAGDGRGSDSTIIGAPVSTDPAPLGRSIFDRGAFMIEAMRLYAPDLSLTRAETEDRQVQQRFNLREIPRNRHRLPQDQRYFETTVCMVRMQPELAVRMVMGNPNLSLDLQAAIIDRSRACVGNAKKVEVDATQFRIYIADALYRWVVAARDVPSLIPIGKSPA